MVKIVLELVVFVFRQKWKQDLLIVNKLFLFQEARRLFIPFFLCGRE